MSRGSYCMVLTCPNNKSKNSKLAFFTLPKDMKIAKSWIEFSGRKDLDLGASKDYRMCSEHFTENQFKCIYPRILLRRGSIPHVNGPKSDVLPESESKMIIHEETVQTDQNVPLSNIDENTNHDNNLEINEPSTNRINEDVGQFIDETVSNSQNDTSFCNDAENDFEAKMWKKLETLNPEGKKRLFAFALSMADEIFQTQSQCQEEPISKKIKLEEQPISQVKNE
ncbi:uncharacterized protein LOC123676409 isoform X2 [Harmonia axyridis]|uniref:uncharacterized protein LOC123676409 isoform X2 n=1 Tax=Harmonia axyridis TaxID=115357 RepID=UPI001E277303|nr:uncharacterized protein LOC123676409 isoform X2 [Harmonia axyridis]